MAPTLGVDGLKSSGGGDVDISAEDTSQRHHPRAQSKEVFVVLLHIQIGILILPRFAQWCVLLVDVGTHPAFMWRSVGRGTRPARGDSVRDLPNHVDVHRLEEKKIASKVLECLVGETYHYSRTYLASEGRKCETPVNRRERHWTDLVAELLELDQTVPPSLPRVIRRMQLGVQIRIRALDSEQIPMCACLIQLPVLVLWQYSPKLQISRITGNGEGPCSAPRARLLLPCLDFVYLP